YYSTPDIEDRPGCLAHLLLGKPDLFRVAHNARLITRHAWLLCVSECGHLSADIFGNVYEDGSRPSGGSNVECLFHDVGEVFCVPHQIVVFGARAGYANRVHFLKRIAADHFSWNLARDDDERR